VKIPEYNALTKKTIEEANKGKGLNKYKNTKELFKKLGI
jgi:antitoxin component of RelBE/YafQ-DinJ toxin-antitoxin module